MFRHIIKLIVIGLTITTLGCGTVTTLSALSTVGSTVGSTAATKILEHSAGYGIQSPHTIIQKVIPSVVTVSVEITEKINRNPAPRGFVRPGESVTPAPRQDQFSMGSGFVIREDGLILTNWHVIQNAIKHQSIIRIGFSNHVQYEATIFNYDATSDLALLKINNEDNEKFPKVDWGSKPKLGGHAIVIGSPIGLDFSVSFGIISALDRTILRAAPPFVPFVQTDAAMNRGNSGGPLFDSKGRVIGINTLILSPGSSNSDGGGNIGLGFAIDGQYAQDIVKRLSDGNKIKWSFMGISYRLLDRNETKSNDLKFGENVIVMNVSKDGAVFNKLFIGDIIKKLDGVKVHHTNFASAIARLAPGTKITLEVLRKSSEAPNGEILNIEATLLERQANQ